MVDYSDPAWGPLELELVGVAGDQVGLHWLMADRRKRHGAGDPAGEFIDSLTGALEQGPMVVRPDGRTSDDRWRGPFERIASIQTKRGAGKSTRTIDIAVSNDAFVGAFRELILAKISGLVEMRSSDFEWELTPLGEKFYSPEPLS